MRGHAPRAVHGTYIKNHPWTWWFTARDHDASKTWGPWMQDAGYRTGMFGEYITTDTWMAGVEPGWDTWRSYYAEAHYGHGFQIDDGAQILTPEVGNLRYLTDELLEFTRAGSGPWFASWAPQHPHTVTHTGELHPLPEHTEKFSDLSGPWTWQKTSPESRSGCKTSHP